MSIIAAELRRRCGHDSRSVEGCLDCEAADEIERLASQATPAAPDVVKDAEPHVGADEQGNATLEWWRGPRKITMYPLDGLLLKVWGANMESEMDEVRLEDAEAVKAAFKWLRAASGAAPVKGDDHE